MLYGGLDCAAVQCIARCRYGISSIFLPVFLRPWWDSWWCSRWLAGRSLPSPVALWGPLCRRTALCPAGCTALRGCRAPVLCVLQIVAGPSTASICHGSARAARAKVMASPARFSLVVCGYFAFQVVSCWTGCRMMPLLPLVPSWSLRSLCSSPTFRTPAAALRPICGEIVRDSHDRAQILALWRLPQIHPKRLWTSRWIFAKLARRIALEGIISSFLGAPLVGVISEALAKTRKDLQGNCTCSDLAHLGTLRPLAVDSPARAH